MTKFDEKEKKTYSYIIKDGSEDQKEKNTKKCLIKIKLKIENYKNCLEATKLFIFFLRNIYFLFLKNT